MTKEQAYRKFVKLYDIEVPEEQVQNMYEYFHLQARHNLQYDTLTTGTVHLNKAAELAAMEDEMREAAWFEAKSDLVMKELMEKLKPEVTEEELLALRAEYASEGKAVPASLPCGETKYDNYLVGYNSRLDALQAAILRKKLTHLEDWIDRRRDNAAYYREALRDTRLTLPGETPAGRHSYYLFTAFNIYLIIKFSFCT